MVLLHNAILTNPSANIVTDNKKMEAKGRIEKTEGKAQEKIGKMNQEASAEEDL